jgi:tetratricopeptide (TPR) repeat protein
VKCPECDEKFVDYLYNELSPQEKLKMEEHLNSCESCTKQLSQLSFVRTSFQHLKGQEPPRLVHQRILAHAQDITSQKRRSWLTDFLFKPAAATIMVLLIATGIFYYTQQSTSPGTSTSLVTLQKERGAATAIPGINQAEQPFPVVPASLSGDRGRDTAKLPSIQSSGARYAFDLGNFYFAQRDFEKAIESYSMALAMNPEDASIIRYQLALCYKQVNDCKAAVKELDDIQQEFPDYRDMDKVFLTAGDCYLDLGAYDKAETQYNNLITNFPEKAPEVEDRFESTRNFMRVNY